MPNNLVCQTCGQNFIYAGKLSRPLKQRAITTDEGTETHWIDTVEIPVCPHCYSPNIAEAPPQQVEAVYVYDLTTGNQEALNKLLAEGFVIVARYSKQYCLEKPKAPESQLAASQALSDLQEAEEA